MDYLAQLSRRLQSRLNNKESYLAMIRELCLIGDVYLGSGNRKVITTELTASKIDKEVFSHGRTKTYGAADMEVMSCINETLSGRHFCEIIGSELCHLCIKQNRRKQVEEETSSFVLGISHSLKKTSFSDAVIARIQSPPVSRVPNGRSSFVRLHNWNSVPRYYFNALDSKRNYPACKVSVQSSSHAQWTFDVERTNAPNRGPTTAGQNQWLRVANKEQNNLQRKDGALYGKKTRQKENVSQPRKFLTFNGLPAPVEPPLITVEVSNQIVTEALGVK